MKTKILCTLSFLMMISNGVANAATAPKSFKNFKSNEIKLSAVAPYKVVRNAQGQVTSVSMAIAADNTLPMGTSPTDIKGKEAFFLSVVSSQGEFTPQDVTKQTGLLASLRGNGVAGPLAFGSPYRLTMTPEDGERDYSHKCIPGRVFKVKAVSINLKNMQTGQSTKIGETFFGNQKFSNQDYMDIRRILDSGPQECWELQGGHDLSSLLFFDGAMPVASKLSGVAASAVFAAPKCESRREADGSLFGTVRQYVTQEYRLTLTNAGGAAVMDVRGKNLAAASRADCP